jgi:hypothetical protein
LQSADALDYTTGHSRAAGIIEIRDVVHPAVEDVDRYPRTKSSMPSVIVAVDLIKRQIVLVDAIKAPRRRIILLICTRNATDTDFGHKKDARVIR